MNKPKWWPEPPKDIMHDAYYGWTEASDACKDYVIQVLEGLKKEALYMPPHTMANNINSLITQLKETDD